MPYRPGFSDLFPFRNLTLLVGQQEGHPAYKAAPEILRLYFWNTRLGK